MIVLEYLLFPGVIFIMAVAFFVSWLDRKVSALVQWRVGPPLFQPVYDFFKLMNKETLIPRNSSLLTFLISPVMSFSSVILIGFILLKTNLAVEGFGGDILVVVYLLLIPSFAAIMSGASSTNPLASLGSSREMKLVLSYELPFILALSVVFIKTGGLIDLGQIISFQQSNGLLAGSLSGILALIVTIICFQSKMAQIPFDIPEAEQEIMGGVMIELSGPPLGLFVVSRWILMSVLPLLTVILFLGGINSWVGILKYVGLVVIVILLKNTNPRLRINQTLRFFWGPVTLVAGLSVVLALLGL
ncbi:MAG: complex I subunit 1 family protein [Elusimicrobiota bacterium]